MKNIEIIYYNINQISDIWFFKSFIVYIIESWFIRRDDPSYVEVV